MRIMALTDFHGTYSMVPRLARAAQQEDVEAIVVAGDITNFGPVSIASQIIRGLLVVGAPVVWVPGNCDPPELATHPNMPPHGIHFGTLMSRNIVFVGIGGATPSPFPGMLEYSEDRIHSEIMHLIDRIGERDELILVTHVPPYGTSADVIYTGEHVGSEALAQIAQEVRPSLILCGHIHESRGVDRIDDTLVVNPGPAMNGLYAVVEGERGEWDARLGMIE